jgi:hypothetical protein
VPAIAAQEYWRPAPALHEQDDLFTPSKSFRHGLPEAARKKCAPLLTRFRRLAAQVHELDFGKGPTGHPVPKTEPGCKATLNQRRGLQ